MRFKFDNRKSQKLKSDPRRQIDLVEVQEIWAHPHYVDSRCDDPEQFRAIGWVKGRLFSVIYEIREDDEGEEKLYEEYS